MFCISLFGKCVFCIYNHYILSLDVKTTVPQQNNLSVETVTLSNYKQCAFGSFPILFMEKYLKHQPNYAKGFLFKNPDGKNVGYIWVMLKGGKEVQYKIKHIDAFVFDVCVEKNFRRNGIASDMISYVNDYLCKMGVKEMYLAVRKDNIPAVNLYKKIGFKLAGCRSFARICKINIPYYTL